MEHLTMNMPAAAGTSLNMLGKAMDITASAALQLLHSGTGVMASGGDDARGFANQVMQAQGIGQKVDIEV